MKWLSKNWTDLLLFIWASVWTVAGIYLAVDVVIDNQGLESWKSVVELFIFINFAIYIVYSGFRTQKKLLLEWKANRNKWLV